MFSSNILILHLFIAILYPFFTFSHQGAHTPATLNTLSLLYIDNIFYINEPTAVSGHEVQCDVRAGYSPRLCAAGQ